jgi:DHA1 family bicyclomycin/chloramphenicol resistance-like MFS transporter
VEHTLTIYFCGFAIGILFWGYISDIYGRRPCILLGLIIFCLGSLGCYYSTSLTQLLIFRFVQSFGGSIGSVLGQAIGRDSFKGAELSRLYATIGSALALFPAIGPVIGSHIIMAYTWHEVFIFLIIFALFLVICCGGFLPETHVIKSKNSSFKKVFMEIIQDKKVLSYGYMVAGCNGIAFSYYAEGPFYLMSGLGFTPIEFGHSFILIALGGFLGGFFTRWLTKKYTSLYIMRMGLIILVLSTISFSLITLLHHYTLLMTNRMIIATLISQTVTPFAITMITGSALSSALVNYQKNIGTASSIFGFYYYVIICIFLYIIGTLHTGSLLVMPLYFLAITLSMGAVAKYFLSISK